MNNASKYTKSNLQKDWGKKYDESYSKDYYDSRIWEIEKEILKEILKNKTSKKLMDFACGTGRITKYLEEMGFNDITCVDASNEMLKEAKKKLKKAKFYTIDITSNELNKKFKENSFDITTSFRFFLNAENHLRKHAFVKLNKVLKKGGIFIFNIHGNKKSLRFFKVLIINFLKFLLQGKKIREGISFYRNQLSLSDIENLIKATDLKIKEVYSYSFLPKFSVKILNKKKWVSLEKEIITKKFPYGRHLMIVCEKTK